MTRGRGVVDTSMKSVSLGSFFSGTGDQSVFYCILTGIVRLRIHWRRILSGGNSERRPDFETRRIHQQSISGEMDTL
jgi:hypothetical protein